MLEREYKFYPKVFAKLLPPKSWNLSFSVLPHHISINVKGHYSRAVSESVLGSEHAESVDPLQWTYSLMLEKVSKGWSFLLYKFLRFRHRYIFTRSKKLRVRYVAAAAVMVLCGLYMALASYVPSGDIAAFASHEVHVAQNDQDLRSEHAEKVLKSRTSLGIRMASAVIKKPPLPLHQKKEIGQGDTVSGVLESAGLSSGDAYNAVKAMSKHYDLRKVKPGQKIYIDYKRDGEEGRSFKKLVMRVDPITEVVVEKQSDETMKSSKVEKELVKRNYAFSSEVETSLYGSAARAGIPPQVIAEIIRIYSWNVDFQRDVRKGDKIEVLYEAYETEEGDFARYGEVIFANLGVGGKDLPVYRYEMKDGRVDYFEPDGLSVRKTLMKTPVDGARVSSGFGMRKHPILGYNKMHKGLDFAAPTGTPIYAAGDGVLEFAGRNGGYGNYIRVRHNSRLKTAYAHMHKFARGVSKGKRVKQGDVIGYVGTTGRSTGPHLHYEVLVNSKQVNPRSVDLPTGEQLLGKEKKKFEGLIASIHQQYVSLTQGLKFAHKQSDGEKHIVR